MCPVSFSQVHSNKKIGVAKIIHRIIGTIKMGMQTLQNICSCFCIDKRPLGSAIVNPTIPNKKQSKRKMKQNSDLILLAKQ